MKIKNFSKYIKLLIAFATLIIIPSCSQLSCRCCFDCFKRPAVICSQETCVLDYNDCFKNFEVKTCEQCGSNYGKTPLNEQMFEPYQPIDPDYRLVRGDILEISVFDEEETKISNIQVAPDGKLYYTVCDPVQAEGLTPISVAKEIEKKVDTLFVEPKVTVIPKHTVKPYYQILGRVRNQGLHELAGPLKVREAVVHAGGLISESKKDIVNYSRSINLPYVDFSKSFIVRDSQKLDIDFKKLLLDIDDEQNIYVRPGDYIYIAGTEMQEVYVLGYVLGPQNFPYYPEMTLMSAIASAGGWPYPSPYSPDLGEFLVIRGSLDCPQICEIDINLILCGKARDLYLQPGDIVYAKHKQMRFGRELVHMAIDVFVNTFVGSFAEHLVEKHIFKDKIND